MSEILDGKTLTCSVCKTDFLDDELYLKHQKVYKTIAKQHCSFYFFYADPPTINHTNTKYFHLIHRSPLPIFYGDSLPVGRNRRT